MIITNNVNEIELGNVEQGSEFKIRNSAKAFSILSSGLYSNKIRAIIRELSCNAIDGHKVVGKESTPFSVHLPSRMEPHFGVRDFGVGLDHDSILSIYTTYFESTKTGSNDLIGGLGLGSKSPFSYTDNFTVTSIKDGIRNVYTAFINDTGVPSISRMLSTETDEEAGVEVSFSVNEDDFYKFREEAQYVFSTFDVHPKVEGTYYKNDIGYIQKDIIAGVHHYSGHTFGNGGAYAIMGNIVYPINVPNPEQNLGSLATLLRNSLLIRFDIGSLDIQASREHLSYIPSTIKAIKDKLQEIANALLPKVVAELDAVPNAWNRIKVINQLVSSALFSNTTMDYIKASNIPFTNKITGKSLTSIELYTKSIANMYNIKFTVYNKGYRGKVELVHEKFDLNSPSSSKDYFYYMPIEESTRFLIGSGIKAIRTRAKSYVRNMEYRNNLFVMTPHDDTKPALYDDFLKSIHNPAVITDIDLPEHVATERAKLAYDAFFESYRHSGYYSDSFSWQSFEFDEEDTDIHYYMPMSNKNIVSPKYGNITLERYMSKFAHTGIESIDTSKVVGVRKSGLALIENLPNWINFETYVENLLRFEVKSSGSIYAKFAKQQDSFFNKIKSDLLDLVDNNSPLKIAHKKFIGGSIAFKDSKYVPQVGQVQKLVSDFNFNINVQNSIDKHKKVVHNTINRYPLLINVLNTDVVAVAEYINLIDTHKGV